MFVRFKYVLILLLTSTFLWAAGDKVETVYENQDAIKISKIDNTIVFTGLKNRGLFKIEENKKVEILSPESIILNLFVDGDVLTIETKKGYYTYTNQSLKKVDSQKQLIKQVDQKVFVKKANLWKRINPNTKDVFYAPIMKGNYILFSGLHTGILLYDTQKETLTFIAKGVDASFSKDGNNVVFAKVYDDGENFTDSKIFLYNIQKKSTTTLLQRDGKVKRFPYLEGDVLYFNTNFNIYKMNISK